MNLDIKWPEANTFEFDQDGCRMKGTAYTQEEALKQIWEKFAVTLINSHPGDNQSLSTSHSGVHKPAR